MNTSHKFTLALNKHAEEGILREAATLAALGLAAGADDVVRAEMRFLDFLDGDGGIHSFISGLSLIVMRAKAGELRRLRDEARAANLPYVEITRAMCGAGPVDRRSNVEADSEPEPLAVMVFGVKTILEPVTRRLSLWR